MAAAESVKPSQKKPRPNAKVNKQLALKLRTENNLTYQQIADLQGIDPAAIHRAIKPLLPTEETKVYTSQRAEILAEMQLKLLKSINEDDIKEMPVGQRLMGYGILYDKERLERNQATSISGYDPGSLAGRLQELRSLLDEANTIDI